MAYDNGLLMIMTAMKVMMVMTAFFFDPKHTAPNYHEVTNLLADGKYHRCQTCAIHSAVCPTKLIATQRPMHLV